MREVADGTAIPGLKYSDLERAWGADCGRALCPGPPLPNALNLRSQVDACPQCASVQIFTVPRWPGRRQLVDGLHGDGPSGGEVVGRDLLTGAMGLE